LLIIKEQNPPIRPICAVLCGGGERPRNKPPPPKRKAKRKQAKKPKKIKEKNAPIPNEVGDKNRPKIAPKKITTKKPKISIKSVAQIIVKNQKNAPKKSRPPQRAERNTPPPEQAGKTSRLRRKRQKFGIKTKNAIKSVANG